MSNLYIDILIAGWFIISLLLGMIIVMLLVALNKKFRDLIKLEIKYFEDDKES